MQNVELQPARKNRGLPAPRSGETPKWNEKGFARAFVETPEAEWRRYVETLARRRDRRGSR
jgi:hypothetical protein